MNINFKSNINSPSSVFITLIQILK